MNLQIGDQIDHYQIRAVIAQGGMSTIYRAYDMMGGREVAIKLPDPNMLGDPTLTERFQRELEVMKTLKHPAVQHGLSSGNYNRTPYLVTELVEGESLRKRIETQAPMPPVEAIPLICKVAEGMAHCHENGIVHRDLKPENILITASGQPVILDFGLALTRGAKRVTYANIASSAGTPDYMAPEQIEGLRGDARTDIYAIGTMLYEILSGKVPFTGDTSLAVMAQHIQGTIPRLDKVQSGISPQLAAIVMRCLQRNPEDRYPTLKEFIRDLDHQDAVDTSILNKAAPPTAVSSAWRSPAFIGITILMLLGIVLLIVALRGATP